ncbi:MAG: FAD-dependent oxidoreductase [Hyphomicrobiales bacterium]
MEQHDVVVVGAGPAGLACAARLHQLGIRDVVVLERESEVGGVPRHCGHWGFGWESHRHLSSGPAYAARLRREAKVCDIRSGHSVLGFRTPHVLEVHASTKGILPMEARHVVLVTGAREQTRAQRLIGGTRPPQVMNTSTLQQLVYLKSQKPFSNPVILGGEWVSFSALMTCKHAAIKPAAMIVEETRTDAPRLFSWGARGWYGVPVHRATHILSVLGTGKVEAVEVEHKGQRRRLACDGLIVSGKFVSENTLFATGPLASGSHDHVHFAGNVHGSLKTAGACAVEGRRLAEKIAKVLS